MALIRSREAAVLEAQGAAAEVEAARSALGMLEATRHDPDYLLDVYNARIASVEAELTRLRDEAARTEIRAPVTGHVLRVLQENERMVTAGTPLVELGDLTQNQLPRSKLRGIQTEKTLHCSEASFGESRPARD